MYLLKPLKGVIYIHKIKKFTFHHVSIKTMCHKSATFCNFYSHSTMYLLKRLPKYIYYLQYMNSHSTMYLLKLYICWLTLRRTSFTFHHVSIKTKQQLRKNIRCVSFTFHHVSIKTEITVSQAQEKNKFTFHHVSIKTFLFFIISTLSLSFTFHHVSIKTSNATERPMMIISFTFHHVSIKTLRFAPVS